MSSPSLQQIANSLKRQFKNWDFEKARKHSDNEAQTREYLIEPILKLLGYEKLDHWVTELNADFNGKKGNKLKVDYALAPKGKDPVILIEAKHHDNALQGKVFSQLREYFTNVSTARIGILTNGVVWKFYAGYNSYDKLHEEPFYEFNTFEAQDSDFEDLARFHISAFKTETILEHANEKYLLSKFDQALYEELVDPSEGMIKSIIKRMGFATSTPSRLQFVKDNINYISLKDAYDRLVNEGALSPDSGIITTEEEMQAYQIVKTIISSSSKAMADISNRITHRDLKNQFSILLDNNQRMPICTFQFSKSKKKMAIGKDNWFEIESVDEIVLYKSQILNATKILLNQL